MLQTTNQLCWEEARQRGVEAACTTWAQVRQHQAKPCPLMEGMLTLPQNLHSLLNHYCFSLSASDTPWVLNRGSV